MKLLEYYHKENIFVVKIMRQKSQKIVVVKKIMRKIKILNYY
jgi:hypothetical protein